MTGRAAAGGLLEQVRCRLPARLLLENGAAIDAKVTMATRRCSGPPRTGYGGYRSDYCSSNGASVDAKDNDGRTPPLW